MMRSTFSMKNSGSLFGSHTDTILGLF